MTLNSKRDWLSRAAAVVTISVAFASFAGAAYADRISNPVAVFAGLDKITGRVTSFDVYMNETVQFGALQVTPKVCYSRDDKEAQRIDGFVEVDEITLDRKIRRIFTGWMFAASPGLNAVEHPIYDVWLTGCKLKSDVPRPTDLKLPDPTPQPDPVEQKTQPTESATPPATEPAPTVDSGAQGNPDQGNADGVPGVDGAQPSDGSQPQTQEGQAPLDSAPPVTDLPKINGVVPKSPGLF